VEHASEADAASRDAVLIEDARVQRLRLILGDVTDRMRDRVGSHKVYTGLGLWKTNSGVFFLEMDELLRNRRSP
jgi:hypothetical protein